MIASRALAAVVSSVFLVPVASAASVTYQITSLGGAAWRYDYALSNDTSGVAVDEFSIYFGQSLYENLRLPTGAADWDLVLLQPDSGLPAAGVFDGLALGTLLEPGQTITGFSVVVDYLAAGTPGSQDFEFLDSATLQVIESGVTVPEPLPEPVSSTLTGLGLAICAGCASARRLRSGRRWVFRRS